MPDIGATSQGGPEAIPEEVRAAVRGLTNDGLSALFDYCYELMRQRQMVDPGEEQPSNMK